MPQLKLSSAVQAFIVAELAAFGKPSEVREKVKVTFGIDVTMAHLVWYDQDAAQHTNNKRWVELFTVTRDRTIKRVGSVPIMHQVYRAQRLQRILDIEEERQNTGGARDTLEQAAKEEGGAYTNKHEVTGANGAPVVPAALVVQFVAPDPVAQASDD